MRWMKLYLQLPSEGVGVRFCDKQACETRFQETRWNDGICCAQCAGKRLKRRRSRKTYFCKDCECEFSVKVGSFMFRSRHSVRGWFLAAEEHIALNATGRYDVDSIQSLADRHGFAYTTAQRRREKLISELTLDTSLLLSCICVSNVDAPLDVVENEFNFFMWLLDACSSREQLRRVG